MAGCTDWNSASPNCPRKGTTDQQLLNLVQCADSESGGSVVWSACPGPATRSVIGAPQACSCSNTDDGILTATTSIPAIASLPTKIGETISFASGHTPSTKGSATATSTAQNGQVTTITIAVATSTSAADSSSSGTLSTGAKAGIGVGAAALGVGLIALAAFIFTCYRRKHANSANRAGYQPTAAPGPEAYQSPPPQYASPGYPYNQPVSPMQMAADPAYAGFKSELPGDSVVQGEVRPAHKSELPAGGLDVATSQALDRHGTPSLLSVAGASPAPTGHASMVSDISRAPSVSPSVQYSPSDVDGQGQHGRGPSGGNMTPIAELHG
ncbi:hypothetical protein VM1G_09035 [Cytospora mali]|uniref:Carcinoembryonic antigen-related cell adhesion molecule 1 n=1 Tax=Cytospora mali TaxID=578113 RepID=A0A194WA10_CYTMA|nr:hypothetical protein VM1G_09035 [Valsa mali]